MIFEAKVTHGAGAGAVVGLVIWVLVAYVPVFHDGVPEPVVAVLPFALAWVGHVLAAYRAPHTARPDLTVKASPPGSGPQNLGGHL